jgi:hypothetical protein
MKTTTKRKLVWIFGGLAILWLSFVGFVGWAMRQPPEVFGHVMARMPMPAYFLFPFETMWMQARKGQLAPGDQAPDLTVKTLETKPRCNWPRCGPPSPSCWSSAAIPDRPSGGRFPP